MSLFVRGGRIAVPRQWPTESLGACKKRGGGGEKSTQKQGGWRRCAHNLYFYFLRFSLLLWKDRGMKVGVSETGRGAETVGIAVFFFLFGLMCCNTTFLSNTFESVGGPEKSRFFSLAREGRRRSVYLAFWVFLGRSTAWMLGSTPPWAMVTPESSLFSSSSLRMAS